MLAVGNNCGDVCFWNIVYDEDNGIYVYYPHSGLVSGISIHPYSLYKAMKLDEKNIARVLLRRITEFKFFPAGDTRMLVVGNNCGDVCFWNIDSDEDNGIYVYHPHSGLVSGISIHPYSLYKSPGEPRPISMIDLSMSFLVDDKKLVGKFMGIKSNEGLVSGISIHPYFFSKSWMNIMAPPKKLKNTYSEEIGLKNSPGEPGPISMSDLSMSFLVDDKKLVGKFMGIKSNEGCCRVTHCVDVKAMKLENKNMALVLPGRIMEVKFFHAGDTRMLAIGHNCGNV
ncbi:hypothetical protein L1987_06547 [Smallanthus sonchifolius]|uniref:Uncharacterized protein n=1 Tax=Smallanthus sonchifolius TaxID=185202 RepID=A0ACB9JYM4_9ASTR|nr:hypothetical protein L1987_06547 [Smallanthus sonchifolius]